MKSNKRRAPAISRRVREQFASSKSVDGSTLASEDTKKRSKTDGIVDEPVMTQPASVVASVLPRSLHPSSQSEPDTVRSGSQISPFRTPIKSVMMTINTVTGSKLGSSVQSESPEASVELGNDALSKLTETNATNEWIDEVSTEQKEDPFKGKLEKYIRGEFFDKCKFISVQKINNWSSDANAMCLKIARHLHVKEHKYEAFWALYAKSINRTLNNRRNDVSNLVQRSFIGKCEHWVAAWITFFDSNNPFTVCCQHLCTEQYNLYQEDMTCTTEDGTCNFPRLHNILKWSENNGTYNWMVVTFMKHGVGARSWNQQHLRFPISKFCSPSTEALLLLIIENSYDRWVDKAINPDKPRSDLIKSRYTNGGISQQGGLASSKKGGGWSAEGIHRFNALCMMVKQDRVGRGQWELKLMHQMRQHNTCKSWLPGNKRKKVVEEVEVLAMHDFDDVEEEEIDSSNAPLEGQV